MWPRLDFSAGVSQAQNKIDGLTNLDRALYEAGKDHYEKVCPPDAVTLGQTIPTPIVSRAHYACSW